MKLKGLLTVFVAATAASVISAHTKAYVAGDFAAPDMSWRPVPLWFWNNTSVNEDQVVYQLEQMLTTDGYGGCAILPFGGSFTPGYLSNDYFSLYGKAIEIAREHGAAMSIYDEYGFPSGSMGAINGSGVTTFKNNHPEHCIKRLDKTETTLKNGSKVSKRAVGSSNLMSVVAFDKKSHEVINLREFIDENNGLEWTVPDDGNWTLMIFKCVKDDDPNVDYLSPEAVKLFVEDTHQQYYNRFSDAFGSVVKSTFFDEPTMYRASGRMWTGDFNEKFEAAYGFSPETLYPALWYDMGENTAAARNMLFGLHARLYSEGFMKTIGDWAAEHGILATGHQDQEEVLNPCSVSGDLMLVGKHISMPGIDKIGGDRPAEHFYKVVSSSANNWDKTYVMSETYGAMGNISVETMYRVATEQYTKGVNHLIPHAVWYNDQDVTFLPELSWRNPLYKDALPDFNRFLSRLNYMLARPARHVASVAMLYPINTLQAGHYLDGPLGYMAGGVSVPGTDYNVVSRILTDEIGVDFTYLHPDVIDDRCSVEGDRLVMHNTVNTEKFSVMILPGCKTLTTGTLKKIEEACDAGVKVIFTTQLPCESADRDTTHEEVAAAVERMLASGGAEFVADPTAESLAAALAGEELDVRFSTSQNPFNYIHKVVDEGNVYYFGNIDDYMSTCTVTVRGELGECSLMNPRTGTVVPAEVTRADGFTTFTLTLAPEQSVFLVENSILDPTGAVEPSTEPEEGYTIEMDFNIESLSAGVCFGVKNQANFYMWQINCEDEARPLLRPHRWMGGDPSCMAEVPIPAEASVTPGTDNHLKIVVTDEKHADTYINGVLVDMRDGDFPLGGLGFRQGFSDKSGNRLEIALFDNISVTADPEGTVLMECDFEEENPFYGGELRDGTLRVVGVQGGDRYAWSRLLGEYVWFTMEADLTLVEDDLCYVFSHLDNSNYYMWALNIFDGSKPRIRHHIFTNGALNWNDSEFSQFTKAQIKNTPRHMLIEVKGGFIDTYIDDMMVDRFLDFSSNLTYGKVGFRIDSSSQQNDEAYIDNVKVTEYNAGGEGTVVLFDDFEPGSPRWFPDGNVVEHDGSRQLHIVHPTGGLIKMVQVDEPVVDGIAAVAAENVAVAGRTYSMTGVEVNPDASVPGIYVRDGKKIVIR
ncbi:MAG: hypothetical protein HDS68_01645 [Bacteroidales bacterium]|nr:hypothetical protein [Bacteroidales bacterium]